MLHCILEWTFSPLLIVLRKSLQPHGTKKWVPATSKVVQVVVTSRTKENQLSAEDWPKPKYKQTPGRRKSQRFGGLFAGSYGLKMRQLQFFCHLGHICQFIFTCQGLQIVVAKALANAGVYSASRAVSKTPF